MSSTTVMAYRVERAPGGYQIHVDSNGNITTVDWAGTGMGVSISFGMPDHSSYYAGDKEGARGLRLVTFEVSAGFWNGIKFLKKFGTSNDQTRGKQWLEAHGWRNSFTTPSGSDGASLSSFTKKTALTFGDPQWGPVLLAGVVRGTARVEYLNENENLPWVAAADAASTTADVLFTGSVEQARQVGGLVIANPQHESAWE
jgi:hypothetical protein